MDFSLDTDHLALRDAVRRYTERAEPLQTRGNAPTPQRALQRHAELAELGLLGLALPEDQGGLGLGAVETALVAQELGAALAGESFLPHAVLVAPLLAALGSDTQRASWLPALAAGQLRMALACHEEAARHALDRVATQARRQADGWCLTGRKSLVLGGDVAERFLVVARVADAGAPEGLSLFAVPADAPGLHRQAFRTLDARGAAHLALQDVPLPSGALVGPVGGASSAIHDAADRACAALVAESAGALDALLAQTCEHLKTRQQFGAPLARFQALQHAVADMAIALEQLKSMACLAAMALDGPSEGRARRVSAAKVLAGQLGRRSALAAIQMHGAMGMTDECRIGHLAKRLITNGLLFGDAAHHLARFAGQPSTIPETETT